ncbi:MAG: DUF6359 domain-containing protein [Prevotella sp.]
MKAFIYFILTLLFISLSACEKPYFAEKKKDKKESTINSEEEKEEEQNSSDKKKNPSKDKQESGNNTPTPQKPNPGKEKEDSLPNNPSKDKYDNGKKSPTEDYVSISDFLKKDYLYQIWVQGYIVGSCSGNIKNATLEAPFNGQSAILLADSFNEKDIKKMIAIELKSRSRARKELNLVDNPNNFGRKIKVFGYQEEYLNIPGIKSWGNSYEWVK